MAHIHEKIDFTVAIFVVHDRRFCSSTIATRQVAAARRPHRTGRRPEQAALREAKEESGLDVELLGERPPTTSPGTRALIAPRFLDIHRISDHARQHRHDLLGAAGSAGGHQTPPGGVSANPVLATVEHHDIRWCSIADLTRCSRRSPAR